MILYLMEFNVEHYADNSIKIIATHDLTLFHVGGGGVLPPHNFF